MRSLLLAFWLVCCGLAAADTTPEVLIVNSYHQGYRWSDDILRGIEEILRASDTPLKIHIEYLDSKRHPQAMHDPALLPYLHAKYDGTRFRVVITTDDNATWFVLRERDGLLPGVPQVFCGVNDLQPGRLLGRRDITGINESPDIDETLACMLRLHPRTRRLLVITDGTETGQGVTRAVERWRPRCPAGVGLELVNQVTQGELADLLDQAGDGTVVLYAFFFQDRTGRTFDADESAQLVMAHARVPVYTAWDFNQGFGMVGGKQASGLLQGRAAGRMAQRILAGTPVADLPVCMESPRQWWFEQPALLRFGIPAGMLPPDSRILFSPPSFFQMHRPVLLGAAGVSLVLCIIIVLLGRLMLQRRRSEGALRISEQRYRELVDLAVDGILTGAPDGIITAANARMLAISGRTRGQLIGSHVSSLFDPVTLGQTPLRFDLLDQGGTVINERTIRQPDGNRVTVEMHSRRMPDGSYHSIYRDITARRQAEAAVLEANLRHEAFFQGARDAILVADPDSGLLVEANRAAEVLLGCTHEELIGLPQAAVHPPDLMEQARAIFQRHASGDSHLVETEVQLRDGGRIPVEIGSRMIELPDGRRRVVGIFRDIRERQLMAGQLRQAEKLTAIGQLAGGVAHDFNNQLAGILGYAELIANRVDDQQLRRYTDGIMRAVCGASNLTQQLLAFARKGRNLNVPTDPDRLIREVVDLLSHSIDKRIDIRHQSGGQAVRIMGDPNQLLNALLNLGLNARDAMPHGGTLTFATRLVAAQGADGEQVEITVADTGCGMDAATRRQIFEPFFTTKDPGKGTGLGLAAVYGTVRNHGGTIEVYSEPGLGSAFTIRLLRHQGVADAAAETPASLRPQGGTARILVIEDEESVRTTAIALLTDLGYQVDSAADGESAIAFFRERWADVDLVFLDMILPRMGGREIFQALRRIDPAVRVLLASGYSLDGAAQELIDAGAIGFLQKPYQYAQLASTMAEILTSGGGADPVRTGV